jgi:hypothetical protein
VNIDKDRAERAFAAYVAAYDPTNPKISLKIDHTYRVADLAERIARSLAPCAASPAAAGQGGADRGPVPVSAPSAGAYAACDEDASLAWLLGLLHDIGRFEQVRRWGTFNDAQSVGHAQLGARILFDCAGGQPPLIRSFVEDDAEDDLIRTAVGLHSAWRLPEGLDDRARRFCEILRDADKVDILKVNCIDTVEAIYGMPESALLESALSDEALSWFSRHSTIPRDARHYPADILLGHVCFAWELAYPESRRIMVEQGYVFQMMERPFTRPATRAAFARMEADLKAYLAEQGIR